LAELTVKAPEFLQREMLECLWKIEKARVSKPFSQLFIAGIQDKIGVILAWVDAVTSYHRIDGVEEAKSVLRAVASGSSVELAELKVALQRLVAAFCT